MEGPLPLDQGAPAAEPAVLWEQVVQDAAGGGAAGAVGALGVGVVFERGGVLVGPLIGAFSPLISAPLRASTLAAVTPL